MDVVLQLPIGESVGLLAQTECLGFKDQQLPGPVVGSK